MVTPIRQRLPRFDDFKNTLTPDPITLQYIDIVRKLNLVKAANPDNRQTSLNDLYLDVKNLIEINHERDLDNSAKKTENASEKLAGKNSLFRGHMLAKRIGFTARSVLTATADISHGQIRVPEFMTVEVAKADRVYNLNKTHLQKLVDNGKATYVLKYFYGVKKIITVEKGSTITLDDGDIVYRPRENGDMVIFNRQPTLTENSMRSYEISKDTEGSLSIGMFPSSDEPHHADHDGDEGNLHFPLGLEEEAEAKFLMNAKYNIMCRGTHKPAEATIMDTLTGAHLLSYFDKVFRPKDAIAMLLMVKNLDLDDYNRRMRLFGLHPYSGRAIFSAIIPTMSNKETLLFQYQHDGITIIDSVLVRGIISKDDLGKLNYNNKKDSLTSSHLGTKHRSIIQDLHKQYGAIITSNFISTLFKIITYYMSNVQDISAGIMDCIGNVPGKTRKIVDNKITDILLHIESLGEVPPISDTIAYSMYQTNLGRILDTVDALGIKLVGNMLAEGSALGHMLKGFGSGAKGTKENIAQIEGALSQQHIGGKRPDFPTYGPQRLLNFYEEGDRPLDIRSHGFVKSSFLEGLQPDEFFMHGMSSREGITASKTSTPDSGDLQRKMVMFFQNLIVQYDGTVRNANGRIVQMMYADGFDSARLMEVKIGKDKNSKVNFIDPHIEIRIANSKVGWILIDENNL